MTSRRDRDRERIIVEIQDKRDKPPGGIDVRIGSHRDIVIVGVIMLLICCPLALAATGGDTSAKAAPAQPDPDTVARVTLLAWIPAVVAAIVTVVVLGRLAWRLWRSGRDV